MNNQSPFDSLGDESVEARITAWVLGEASAFEIAELERLCQERPELEAFRQKMLDLHGLMTEAENMSADDSWKLPPAKRKAIDDIAGNVKFPAKALREKQINRTGRRAIWGIAACVTLTAVVWKLVNPQHAGLERSVAAKSTSVDFMPPVEQESDLRNRLAKKADSETWLPANPGSFRMNSASRSVGREEESKKSRARDLIAKNHSEAPKIATAASTLAEPFSDEAIEELPSLANEGLGSGIGQASGGGGGALQAPNQIGIPQPPASPAAEQPAIALSSSPVDASSVPNKSGLAKKLDIKPRPGSSVRRGDFVSEGDRLLAEGREAYSKGEYEIATDKYRQALDRIPDTEAFKDRRKSYTEHLGDAGVSLSIQKRKAGKYKEARKPLVDILKVDPENLEARREIDYLDDPIRSSSTLSQEHTQNDDKVRRGLYTAEGNYNLGKYDEAKREYDEVLRLDPYNAAARRGLERVKTVSSEYYRAAYDHTRAELLSEVDQAWELTVPSANSDIPATQKDAEISSIAEFTATENPYSTFSLNINDASFQLAKAALEKGERPSPADIKVEQFYNAVDYGDPAPSTNEPVAATVEQSAHPIVPARNLVRIALKTGSAGRRAAQPLRLTLLVDQSGSMVREDRRAAMDQALSQLGALLTKNDLVTVIGFSRTPRLLADGLTGDQAGKLKDLANQEASEGGTNLEEAMKLGDELAERHYLANAQNRIVLFTDGAANLGNADPARLAEKVKAFRQKGLAFDIAGIGADGLNDRLLSELARNGNGRYYVVGDEKNDSFAKQLAGAFRPAAENVKVQVIFNPQRVGKYKLIGFEKDLLKTEDFRNDSVDAAELAAEEAGVAIYQVESLPQGSGEIGEISVRFRNAASGEMVERSWTIPHEEKATAFDRAAPSMQLAGLSLLAAEKLRGGPMADAIDFKQFAQQRSLVKQFYGSSKRVADMLQVIDSLD
jgi:Mg-chelatase subunit ChlD